MQGEFMAINYKKTSAHEPGQAIKFRGNLTGGSMTTVSGSNGGAGADPGVVSWTIPGPFGSNTTTVSANDTVNWNAGTSGIFSSTKVSQSYLISESDSSFNATSAVLSGSLPVDINTFALDLQDRYDTTYSEAFSMGPLSGNYYWFIGSASGVPFKLRVTVIGGGGAGGGGGGAPE